jgi:hypothetical protein
MNAPTIADPETADIDGRCQRRPVRGREHVIVKRDIETQVRKPLAQRRHGFELCDTGINGRDLRSS